jgi:hypothetical protein
MKKLILVLILIPTFVYSGDIPSWVYNSAQKNGDVWLFSGSVHNVSILNVGVPLARSAGLSNLASSIGVNVTAAVGHKIDGSEIDGYTEVVSVSQGYILDRVAAYGVRQKEIFTERFNDPGTGRIKFNVHVLLEVADTDLQKAKNDFARRAYVKHQKPIMKSKEEAGLIKRLIRKIGL